jgi:hypothetical protein
MAVEESRGEINLAALPVSNSKQTADEPQGFQSKGQREYLLVIKAMYLRISHCNKSSLQLLDGSIGAPLHFKHSFRFSYFLFLRPRYKRPSLHSQK